ncbi:conserved domain protein [Paraprevotella xylaniphila YIT 11841]|uniref:Conserved domain protein n=1 Tax=Paraprevotella xylaniphila YIT 11841 TaxID=762982 RepID=F3QW01_9BACT|nr:conserved domain protein [Paraprevotella xylaniphila YIT 11841]
MAFFWIFIHKNLFGWLLLDFLRLSYSFFLTYLRYDGIDFLLSFCYKTFDFL